MSQEYRKFGWKHFDPIERAKMERPDENIAESWAEENRRYHDVEEQQNALLNAYLAIRDYVNNNGCDLIGIIRHHKTDEPICGLFWNFTLYGSDSEAIEIWFDEKGGVEDTEAMITEVGGTPLHEMTTYALAVILQDVNEHLSGPAVNELIDLVDEDAKENHLEALYL